MEITNRQRFYITLKYVAIRNKKGPTKKWSHMKINCFSNYQPKYINDIIKKAYLKFM